MWRGRRALSDVLEDRAVPGVLHFGRHLAGVLVGLLRRLLFLPSGHLVPDPATLVSGNALGESPRSRLPPNYIIIDTPPAALFATAHHRGTSGHLDPRRRRSQGQGASNARHHRLALAHGPGSSGIVLNRSADRSDGRYYPTKK